MDRKITIADWGGKITKGKIAVTLAVVLSSQISAEERHPQFTLPDVVIRRKRNRSKGFNRDG